MRLALIEIGSRATRLLVADVETDGTIRVVWKSRRQIALGQAVDAGREAVAAKIAEVARQCNSFERDARSWKVDRLACFGTEALRRIRDQKLFNLSSLKAVVLDAEMEAECAFWAAVKDPDVAGTSGESFVVVDLGSGSVEMVSGALRGAIPVVSAKKSIGIGANWLVDVLQSMGLDLSALSRTLCGIVAKADVPHPNSLSRVILSGGIATKIAWLNIRDSEDDRYDEKKVSGVKLAVADIENTQTELADMVRKDPARAQRFVDPLGNSPDEYLQVIGGSELFIGLLRAWGKSECFVSTQGPRHGVAYKLALARR